MISCFTKEKNGIPIYCIHHDELSDWLSTQKTFVKNWVQANKFQAKPQELLLIPNNDGSIACVVLGIKYKRNLWDYADLYTRLPAHAYYIDGHAAYELAILAWGLASYQYRKKESLVEPTLYVEEEKAQHLFSMISAIHWVRDLVNTPANLMGPMQLQEAALSLKSKHATVTTIVGDALKQAYPAVYHVGQASPNLPRLIDIQWGDPTHPKLVLAGKGVCFDTGGLDIKPSPQMRLMKKDMGGAAHVLALARMIMEAKLAVNLRVLIPAVENSVSGNANRPGDVIPSRAGIQIEIDNTDAEGRLCLADALYAGCETNPDLVIDFATLTGAARAALGPDIPVFFTPNDQLANQLQESANKEQDPLWRLPLYQGYESWNDTMFADIKNSTSMPYAGAITAALFLQRFVKTSSWIHIDLFAWNLNKRPGRPEGGEAMGLRAVWSLLLSKYGKAKS